MMLMRTTVDLDPSLLEQAKRLALERRLTLSAVVAEALAAHLASQRVEEVDPPFELLVRGEARDRFPSAADMTAVEEGDDLEALDLPGRGRDSAAS